MNAFETDNLDEKLLQKFIKKANWRRNAWAKSDALRDAGIKEPEGVNKIADISYAESDTEDEKKWHLLDIYYPADDTIQDVENMNYARAGKYPVIVSVHGGGWFYGDKELYKLYTMTLATYGFAVVNFNYRLSPEYQYPAGFADVCCLMDYLIAHAKEYSLDMEHVYMVGDSAGAQLVSQYCIYATNKKYRELFSFSKDILPVLPKKIALNCGVYDVCSMLYEDEVVDWYLPFDMKKNTEISLFKMLDFMTKDFPETYLMLSVNDDLAKHTIPMKNKLREFDIPFVYREFGQDEQSDGHVFHLNLKSRNGQIANHEEMKFFYGS